MSITTNTPFGIKPIRRFDGGVVGRVNGGYSIVDSYASAIGLGDPVKRINNWQQNVNMGNAIVNGPEINIATSESPMLGGFDGCQYQDTQGNFIWSKNWVASVPTLNTSGAQAFVYDDPEIVYQVQGDAAYAASLIGKFTTLTTIGSPNSLGISQAVAHEAGNTTTIADSDVKILNFVVATGPATFANNTTATYPLLEVVLTQAQNAAGQAYPST
jgi:hypothetical protein